ncbi:MAG TPA: YgiQ family radical SAM protein [Smithellaceae bacterium]|nr:YgiQ family radical SAM protein [Smithellaceae bacterium]HRS90071.1 YgiQ family radical SAM protein [Smithellaceae bacterium]HRV26921.1 YgiQ family radical SAM protein [Smithellaceae bacterium]
MFLPTTSQELKNLGWDRPDIILITGDAYIDSPHIGVAVIGRVLANAGYRVGIIAQPDLKSGADIARLGEPKLFWGITGGCMDSLVANYTATKKKRHGDDLTPGGKNNRRPDRAVIAYANLIRQYFKNTRPLVLGGVEASLRRVAHYDYWSDSVRRAILFDARADILAYGMAEKAILEIARRLKFGQNIDDILGTCVIAAAPPAGYLELPSYEDTAADKNTFIKMFDIFYANNDPLTAKGLYQQHGNRYLVHHPPQPHLTSDELDKIYALDYAREVHPHYLKQGNMRAMDTIKFSLSTHRGCYGECNFCSIGLHEGRKIISRSEASILEEAKRIAARKDFKGYIVDVGGATANMYGIDCARKDIKGACPDKRCLVPQICPSLKIDHARQIRLLKNLRKIPGVKKVFVASGLRHDLVLADKKSGTAYLGELCRHHISGQLKIAPEHASAGVLKLMGKPPAQKISVFKKLFEKLNAKEDKKQFLTYYFIAAHPGCNEEDMRALKTFAERELKINPEQVQIFTPLPSTYSALMYWTGIDPSTGKKIFVEKDTSKKQRQKNILIAEKQRLLRIK